MRMVGRKNEVKKGQRTILQGVFERGSLVCKCCIWEREQQREMRSQQQLTRTVCDLQSINSHRTLTLGLRLILSQHRAAGALLHNKRCVGFDGAGQPQVHNNSTTKHNTKTKQHRNTNQTNQITEHTTSAKPKRVNNVPISKTG